MPNSNDGQFFFFLSKNSWNKKRHLRPWSAHHACVHAQKCVRVLSCVCETKTGLFAKFSKNLCFSCVWEKDTWPECVCVCVCVSVCVHTPSPRQRCSSSLPAVVFSSRLAWPGCPPSSPSGFCLEFHLSARESDSTRQPSAGGLDTQTHRKTAVTIPQMDRFTLLHSYKHWKKNFSYSSHISGKYQWNVISIHQEWESLLWFCFYFGGPVR